MKLTIIKIGGSVITHKNSNVPSINVENIKIIASQLRILNTRRNEQFIIIHGVGSFGHPIVKATGIHEGIRKPEQIFAFAQTQKLQNQLNCQIVEALQDVGLPVFPMQISDNVVMENGRIADFNLDAVKGLLELGLIPIGFGVPAYDRISGCSILSGDQSAPYLALKLKAYRIIVAGDVPGIFTHDPKINQNAKLIKTINPLNDRRLEKSLGGSAAIDVTGGMKQKYLELANAARAGIPSRIVMFTQLDEALRGEHVGTEICAVKRLQADKIEPAVIIADSKDYIEPIE